MKILRFFLVLIGVGLMFVVGFGYGRWYSTRPAATNSARKILYYVDPMHPWYKSDKPGIAPDCGMKLEPVYAAGGGQREATASEPPADAVQVSPEQQHLIGVRYGEAEWSAGSETIHAAGRVMPDETLMTRVQARTDGWISEVSADFTGKFVTKGQPLLTLYSPELLAAQQEYLLALKARTVMQHSSMQESMANNDALAEAARRRLLLLNLTEAQIAAGGANAEARAIGCSLRADHWLRDDAQRVSRAAGYGRDGTLHAGGSQRRVGDGGRVRGGCPASAAGTVSACIDFGAGTGGSTFARVTYIQPQIDPVTRTTEGPAGTCESEDAAPARYVGGCGYRIGRRCGG